MKTKLKYNHALTFAFSLDSDVDCVGLQNPHFVREAILNHLAKIDDAELLENIGLPFDTYENE